MLSKDEYQKLRLQCTAKFRYAKKHGRIKPITESTKCVDCGKPAEMYDHRDYYKPLEVNPVCRTCNTKRGPAYPYCENWNKPRAGNEAEIESEIDYGVPLLIEFDLQGYEDHEEYEELFRQDAEEIRYNKYSSEDYYTNKEKANKERAKAIKYWRKAKNIDYYKRRKVESLLEAKG